MKIEKNNENFMLKHNLMNNKQFIFYNKYFDNWLNINTKYIFCYIKIEISFFKNLIE